MSTDFRAHRIAPDEQDLVEEIAYLTSRLDDMGTNGDCAYERALARAFSAMVQERTRQLCQLRAAVRSI